MRSVSLSMWVVRASPNRILILVDPHTLQVVVRCQAEELSEHATELTARHAGPRRHVPDLQGLGVAFMHHFHDSGEPVVGGRQGTQSVRFPPDAGQPDDLPHPVPQRNLAEIHENG